jgi:hypothetical protein
MLWNLAGFLALAGILMSSGARSATPADEVAFPNGFREVDGDSRCGWEAILRNHRSPMRPTLSKLASSAIRRKKGRATCFPHIFREISTREDSQTGRLRSNTSALCWRPI